MDKPLAVEDKPEVKKISKVDTTKIVSCTCKSSYQDKVYGLLKRLHNTNYKGSSIKGHTCTVCGNFKLNK